MHAGSTCIVVSRATCGRIDPIPVIENRYLWAVLAYIERNLVRAGLVAQCQNWPWSSASTHLDRPGKAAWIGLGIWKQNWTAAQWSIALQEGLVEAEWKRRLQEATCAGRPFGGEYFLKACEQQPELRLLAQKPGPKRQVRLSAESFS